MKFEFSKSSARKLLLALILFETFLVFCYLGGNFSHHSTKFFDLDAESNFPTWFSSIQLFLVGQIFLFKSVQLNAENRHLRLFLQLACLGFVFLSADYAAQIHETLGSHLKYISWLPRFKGDHGVWIFIYGLICLILFYSFFSEIQMMFVRYRRATFTMLAGAVIAVFGGVILEIISYQFLRDDLTSSLYTLEVAFEEFFEMLGISITLYGALIMLLQE